jgi:hypothetical protein
MPGTEGTAWDFIGFDGRDGLVRIVGGRATYEAVDYDSSRGGKLVRLSRLDTTRGLHVVTRYVAPDTRLQLIRDRP